MCEVEKSMAEAPEKEKAEMIQEPIQTWERQKEQERQEEQERLQAQSAAGGAPNHNTAGAQQTLAQRYRMPQEPRQPEPEALRRFRKQFSIFGAASAIYALFYAFCLYRNASGITYPFFVAGTLCYFGFCMKKCGVPWKKDAAFYVISLLLLGLSVCLTADWKILWMTKTGIFLLSVSFLLHHFYRDGEWGFGKYLSAILRSLWECCKCLHLPFADCYGWIVHREEKESRKQWRYVLLGLLVAIPLLAVILALLLSADVVFGDMFDRLLGDISLGPVLRVCLLVAAVFLLSYSLIPSLLLHRIPEAVREKKKAEPVLAITFTLPVALLYLLFCGIQIVYLFGGMGQLPEGYSWSSYARQGFFQLLAVCLINLVLVLVCLACFRENGLLRGVLTAISLMTYVLIASSAYRMLLYIQNYYLTFLRVFVLWALAVIALLMTGVILSIYRGGFPLFRYCTVVVTVCYLCLAFAKPDYWIAKYDMAHADLTAMAAGLRPVPELREGDYAYDTFWDVRYLCSLSADAAPVLADEAYREALLASPYGERVKRYYSQIDAETEGMSLRTFNLSRWQARLACD